MRGIALKIFLSFWFIFAVLIATFAILPDRGSGIRFQDHVRLHGLVAAALLERGGAAACAAFSTAVEERTQVRFALFDGARTPVCRGPAADLAVFGPFTSGAGREAELPGSIVLVEVRAPSGATFTAAGAPLTASAPPGGRPPFPYGAIALAIVVSGIVCFAVARYFARPLQQVRDASYRLAAGDLQARVGPRVAARRDEIGDLVRDFDAMAARLEALVHSQGQLLSDISHELRSPLARLNVALELARRKAGPDAAGDLARIEAEAERMNELIGRVLALARAETLAKAERRDPVDLAAVVRRVAEDADYEAQRQHKSVALHVRAAPAVRGDPQLLASAVDNVVRNAVRYTRERTTVEMELNAVDREAAIVVRDHGPGVPAPELERIFSPFHRVEAARNRETGGVGLGLAIARRALAVHGGRISAANAPDGGLVVSIRIPVDGGTATASAKPGR